VVEVLLKEGFLRGRPKLETAPVAAMKEGGEFPVAEYGPWVPLSS